MNMQGLGGNEGGHTGPAAAGGPESLSHNSTPTQQENLGVPFGCADAAAVDERRGSNVYEVIP